MAINARKQEFVFSHDPESYEIFLKKHFTRYKPTYYSVVSKETVDTEDGEMYRLEIVKTIEDPSYEIIAECRINNQMVYLWNDHCWTLATANGKLLISKTVSIPHVGSKKPLSAKIVIYRVGIDKVE